MSCPPGLEARVKKYLKAPRGRPSVLQRVQIGRLRKASADVRLINSLTGVDALLAELVPHGHPSQHQKAG